MNELEQAVQEITAILTDLAIPHMLVGGLALAAWGEARTTLDVDVTLWVGADVSGAVAAIGRRVSCSTADPLAFVAKTAVFPAVSKNGTRVDLIFAAFPFEKEMIDRAVEKTLGAAMIRVATVEDLILLKSVSLRPKDQADVSALLSRFQSQLDRAYLTRRLQEFAQALDRPDLLSLLGA